MPDSSLNEQFIMQYLLGELSETDAERLDELSVTDDDFAQFLERVEYELADDYIKGELSEHNRARFESYYLALPERLEKVAMARAFLDRADQAGTEQFNRIRRTPPASRSYQWIAIAAALLMFMLAGYLVLMNVQLKKDIAQLKDEHADLKQREQQLQLQLEQQHSLDQQKGEELALTKEEYDSAPPKLFAFSLSPQRRAISMVPDINIPAATESIVVKLKLENDDFNLYEVILKDSATDEILWRSNAEQSDKQIVVVQFPKDLLKSQDYILEVFGITKNGKKEIISGYPFRALLQ